jgi:hypothetical protein
VHESRIVLISSLLSMHLDHQKLPPHVARVARAELGLAQSELALRSGYVAMPLAFGLCWLIATSWGVLGSWRELLILMLGSLLLPALLGRAFGRPRPAELDTLLGARGALLTWLGRRRGLARELLARDLELLARDTGLAERRRSRLRRLMKRALLYLALFLLLSLVLPGHAPGNAGMPGSSAGEQSAAEGSGDEGEGKRDTELAQGETPREAAAKEPEVEAQEEEQVEQPQPEPKPLPKPEAEPPVAFRDFVIFPDFREGERKSTRDTGEIERSPLAGEAEQQRRPKERESEQPGELEEPQLEWRRQAERALRRGSLRPWEGPWLTRYGELLEKKRR